MNEMTENIFEKVREKNLIFLTPKKALNKAFLKLKPLRDEIDRFKTNLITLLDRINENESEEFHKNLISDFLKDTYYKKQHFINTKGRNDLVIHNGQNAKSAVGVIIEAKKPNNKAEMITIQKLNTKAFQELVLYYLRERITHKNLEVKHLVATNINEWFIFDANLFDRLFAQNKELIKQFEDFENNRLVEKTTDFFYKQIAEPFIESIISEIEFTYFNIQDYQKPLRNADKEDDNLLIPLFKIFSPEHLLKLSFANDSNTLNSDFYNELLHLMGLTEVKETNKKLIKRNKIDARNNGSILESVIVQLDSLDKLSQIQDINQFGNIEEDQLFNIAIELTITWINRILFLKLLEAQLSAYHKGDKSYSFFNLDQIKNYDDLNSLFFQVLAKKDEERNQDVQKIFEKIPYLNSSLFELTELENKTLVISNLQYNKTIPIFSQTVLKDQKGNKRAGNLNTLEYLFEFLNAYDFGAEGSEEIQEENKTLISASVLGLIFEKINGYKDGSFFTPGFITSYMCRETIRKAIIQKFDYTFPGYKINKIEDIYELIPQKISRKKANEIINSIKICDPAVGSGHFLVSALNELIAIKNDLKILEDKEGKSLHRYEIEIINDELIVIDEEGNLFKYNPNNKESQRIQESLFHEKQTIIENCLFGVDINPNSVKICQLRLWIELLKNAYYKEALKGRVPQLETLPNIDINIKCGNSLISKFDLYEKYNINSEKGKVIDEYKNIVSKYKNSLSPIDKNQIRERIKNIKNTFIEEFNANSFLVKKLNKKQIELAKKEKQIIKEETKIELLGKDFESEANKSIKDLETNIGTINKEIEEIKVEIEKEKNQEIYKNSFEWRFEFPEVLDESGNFTGFDVIIGNPPYINVQTLGINSPFANYLKNKSIVWMDKSDILFYFIELVSKLSNNSISFIVSNAFLFSDKAKLLRNFILQNCPIYKLINFERFMVFDQASITSMMIFMDKSLSTNYKETVICNFIESNYDKKELLKIISEEPNSFKCTFKKDSVFALINLEVDLLNKKIDKNYPKLGELLKVGKGMETAINEVFCFKEYPKQFPKEFIKKRMSGEIIEKYTHKEHLEYLLYIEDIKNFKKLPIKIQNHLLQNKEKLENRATVKNEGRIWWRYSRPMHKEFYKFSKIWCSYRASENKFCLDESNDFIGLTNTTVIFGNNDEINLKYVLALLNSKLLNFRYKSIGKQTGGGIFEYFENQISQFPIPKISHKEQKTFIDLVEKILSLKEQNKDTAKLENQIDKLVCKLYDLTEEEIEIIEETSM